MKNIENMGSPLKTRTSLYGANFSGPAAAPQTPPLQSQHFLKEDGTAGGSQECQPVLLRGSSNYQRIRALRDVNTPPPARSTAQQKNAPIAEVRQVWNCKTEQASKAPKERLPRITMKTKNKFDYLFGGRSVSDATVRHCQEYVDAHTSDYRKKCSKPNSGVPKQKKELLMALKKIDFAAALAQWDESNELVTDTVKRAREIFNALAMGTERITAEMLLELLLLTTPPGVALYEAFDFFYEFCDQKKHLEFRDFLFYGEKLCERIFAYEKFASLDDKKKLVTTANRVLLGVLPTSNIEIRRLLFEALKNQETGRMKGTFKPMRMYEFLFLVDLNKRLKRKKTNTHTPKFALKS